MTSLAPTSGTTAAERKLAKEVNEEYHDPYDDWGARDILLSLVPFIVVFAFKDSALNTALAFAIAWSIGLLIMRLAFFDGFKKLVWPIIDIAGFILWALLRGFTRSWYYHIHKWVPVIVPLYFALNAILSLLWRRPFTAHYARFPKFDKGGKGLFHGDSDFRRAADVSTMGWISFWSVSLLFSLIPILTGHWFTWHALNVIFNYVIPFILLVSGIVFQQLVGAWYRKKASHSTGTSVVAPDRGTGHPAGEAAPGSVPTQPTTYSSAV